MSAFLLERMGWRDDFAVLAGLYAFSLLGVIILGDETLYDRHKTEPYPRGLLGRFQKLIGIASIRMMGRPTVASTWAKMATLAVRPEVLAVSKYIPKTRCYSPLPGSYK